MARARNIKPSIFKNEILGEADPILTVVFIGLWCLADREGRLEDRPKRIKAELLPYRECPEFNGYLTELARLGFIRRYSVGNEPIIQVVNFAKHQSPHKTEKPSELPEEPEESASCVSTVKAPLFNESATVKESLIPDSGLPDSGLSDSRVSMGGKPPASDPDEFIELRSIYPKRSGDHRWKKALDHCRARLKEGHTWDEILDGARRYAGWCKATDKIGTETVKQAATFVGTEKGFLEPWLPPKRQLSPIERVLNPEKADDRLVN